MPAGPLAAIGPIFIPPPPVSARFLLEIDMEAGTVKKFDGEIGSYGVPPFNPGSQYFTDSGDEIRYPGTGVWDPASSALYVISLPTGNRISVTRWKWNRNGDTWERLPFVDNSDLRVSALISSGWPEGHAMAPQIGSWPGSIDTVYQHDAYTDYHEGVRTDERFLVRAYLGSFFGVNDLLSTTQIGPPFFEEIESDVRILSDPQNADLETTVYLRPFKDLLSSARVFASSSVDLISDATVVDAVDLPSSTTIQGLVTYPVINLNALGTGDPNEIFLSWLPNPLNVNHDAYIIERSPVGAGTWIQINTLPPESVYYIDATVVEGNKYDYRVVAFLTTDGITAFNAYANVNSVESTRNFATFSKRDSVTGQITNQSVASSGAYILTGNLGSIVL